MTELSFLLDLLLHEEMPKILKEIIVIRIKKVEGQINDRQSIGGRDVTPPHSIVPTQIHGAAVVPQPTGFAGIAIPQTQAAAEALRSREEAIRQAGQPLPGQKSPRKF